MDSMDTGPLVLIVEGNQGTRVLYREFLSHSGFRTAEAHNGFQALEKAQDLRPDIVVTDLALPGMDGFEFCRALQQSSLKDIPILAITGHAEYLDQPERFRHAGISHVLVTPCDPDVVVRKIRRLLKGHTQDVERRSKVKSQKANAAQDGGDRWSLTFDERVCI